MSMSNTPPYRVVFESPRMLALIPPSPDRLHRGRSWQMYSALHEHLEMETEAVIDGNVDPSRYSGALVTNSDSDLTAIRRLRDRGVPTIYYPSLGPVRSGFFTDKTLFDWEHRFQTRLKIQSAHIILVDSSDQAEAAQAHYDLSVPWLIHPGGPGFPFAPPYVSEGAGKVWVIGEGTRFDSALWTWAVDHGMTAHAARDGEVMTSIKPNVDLVFLRERVWHPSALLTWAQTRCGVVCEEASVLGRALPENVVCYGWDGKDADVKTALTKAMGRRGEVTIPTWREWARTIQQTLASLSPASRPVYAADAV